MKYLFLIFLCVSSLSIANQPSASSPNLHQVLQQKFEKYATSTLENLPEDTMDSIDKLCLIEMNPQSDIDLAKNILRTVLTLEEAGPDRLDVLLLSQCFQKNESLYTQAASQIQNAKNKKQLVQIFQILKNYPNGNG